MQNFIKGPRKSPIQFAQTLTAFGLENAYLTTTVLCLNQTLTFSVPSKIKYSKNIS